MIMRGGKNVYATPIGILSLDSRMAKPPGHIKNGTTFDFPVIYQTIEGITPKILIEQPGDRLLEAFIEAAQKLEKEGAQAITGSCGFMVLYQQALADAVNVPLYSSSLIQVPMIQQMLKRDQKIGVITASQKGLTPAHLEAVGIDASKVCIAGMEGSQEFWDVIIDAVRDDLDLAKVEQEVVAMTEKLLQENPDIGALVLECTDMPPYAHAIQQATGLPVFDLSTLTDMVFQGVVRTRYKGFE